MLLLIIIGLSLTISLSLCLNKIIIYHELGPSVHGVRPIILLLSPCSQSSEFGLMYSFECYSILEEKKLNYLGMIFHPIGLLQHNYSRGRDAV